MTHLNLMAFAQIMFRESLGILPWARFRQKKAAVKLHSMIDLKGSIPVFISITDGSVHDVSNLDDIAFEPERV